MDVGLAQVGLVQRLVVVHLAGMKREVEGKTEEQPIPLPRELICAVGYFAKSTYCQMFIESIRNNWREAEIQHEHID